jgi:hypothetical protein
MVAHSGFSRFSLLITHQDIRLFAHLRASCSRGHRMCTFVVLGNLKGN